MGHDVAAECSSPRAWQRFYLGYKERFVEDCCISLANGKEVRLKQAPSAKQFKQQSGIHQKKQKQQQKDLDKQSDPALTGSTVWDGAVVLAQYLTSDCSPLKQYKAMRAEALQRSAQHAAPEQAQQQGPEGAQQVVLQPQQERPHICQASDVCQCQQTGQVQNSQWQDGQEQSLQQPQDQEQPPEAEPPSRPLPGFTCLELGAGTGAVSLSLLAAGAVDYALLTDIPDMLPHLQSNVQHNSSVLDPRKALVLPLRWAEAADVAALEQLGQQQQRQHQRLGMRVHGIQPPPAQLQPPFELIVGSDLIYYSYTPSTPHSRLLLQALVQLAGPDSLIFLALSLHHNPEEVHAFLDWAESDWGFEVEKVTEGVPPEYVVPDVLVVRLQLKDVQAAQRAAAAAADGTLRRKDEQ